MGRDTDRTALRKRLRKRVGIALGGGGALGFSHVGVLRAFEEYGIRPSVVAGNSAGAMIGGFYCAGKGVAELEEIARSIDAKRSAGLLIPSLTRGGLIGGDEIREYFRQLVGDVRIEELGTRFVAAAVDVTTDDLVYIDRGSLVDAIRASISIPGVFVPFRANGTLLVDGGIRDPIPLRALQYYETDITIGVNIVKRGNMETEPRFIEISADDEVSRGEAETEEGNTSEAEGVGTVFDRVRDLLRPERLFPNRDLPFGIRVAARSLSIMMTEAGNREMELNPPEIGLVIDVTENQPWDVLRSGAMIEKGYSQATAQLRAVLGEP